MTSRTHDVQSPAFDAGRSSIQIGQLDGHEELRIPATWPGLKGLGGLVAALPIWIAAASFKFGVKTLYSGWTGLLMILVLATCFFALYAFLQIVWWIGGSERIAVIGQDILVRHTIFGIAVATRSYRGRDIRFLGTSDVPRGGWLDEPFLPFASSGRCGRLRFYYSEASVYLGHDLGPADGRQAATWLAQRLPASARQDAS